MMQKVYEFWAKKQLARSETAPKKAQKRSCSVFLPYFSIFAKLI
jgi:hypothetical protein